MGLRSKLALAGRLNRRQLLNRMKRKIFGTDSPRLNYRPLELMAFITHRCNMSCNTCPFASHSNFGPEKPFQDMTVEMFKKFTAENRSAESIGLVGGEPFLHERLFEFIRISSNNDLHTTVSTNGTLLTEDNIKKLLRSPLDVLNVSLDASDPDGYKRLRKGSEELYWRIVKGIETLASEREKEGSGLKIALSHVVSTDNYDKMNDFIKLGTTLGVDRVLFQNLLSYECSEMTSHEKCLYDTNEMRKKIAAIPLSVGSMEILPPRLVRPDLTTTCCPHPFRMLTIDGDGNISPCCVIIPRKEFGNIHEEDCWNGQKMMEIRNSMIKGSKSMLSICDHCWENRAPN